MKNKELLPSKKEILGFTILIFFIFIIVIGIKHEGYFIAMEGPRTTTNNIIRENLIPKDYIKFELNDEIFDLYSFEKGYLGTFVILCDYRGLTFNEYLTKNSTKHCSLKKIRGDQHGAS